jgi:hypothetical protein
MYGAFHKCLSVLDQLVIGFFAIPIMLTVAWTLFESTKACPNSTIECIALFTTTLYKVGTMYEEWESTPKDEYLRRYSGRLNYIESNIAWNFISVFGLLKR